MAAKEALDRRQQRLDSAQREMSTHLRNEYTVQSPRNIGGVCCLRSLRQFFVVTREKLRI